MKDVTADDINALIRTFDESDWKELAVQTEDFRVFISRDHESAGAPWMAAPARAPNDTPPAPPGPTQTSPAAAPATAPIVPDPEGEAPVPDNCVAIKAPSLGIFYSAPKPGAPPYIELGAEVDAETEVCLIEVMKLFTAVHAGVRGTVRHICVEDAEMVEQGQPLFYIEPAA